MKQRYTLTVANSEINIVTEEPRENIDAIVGIVDRKIREIYLHSKGECSRSNAAILVCLDYCAAKIELQKTIKNLNCEVERLNILNESAAREIAALERELEALRSAMNTNTNKATTKKAQNDQIRLDEIDAEEVIEEAIEEVVEEVVEEVAEEVVEEATEEAVEEAVKETVEEVAAEEPVTEEAPAPEEELVTEEAPAAEKPKVTLKKKKVRAMFDMISFDDI
jgi:cell division protein ZapA (FtsZ GTPase activity inhibitor)